MMGRHGPAPEPTALKLVHGNPGKRPINKAEPRPSRRRPRQATSEGSRPSFPPVAQCPMMVAAPGLVCRGPTVQWDVERRREQ